MKIHLPNSSFLGNIEIFLRSFNTDDPNNLHITLHQKWVSVHPAVLSLTAALASNVIHKNGGVSAEIPKIRSLPYLIRMKLFEFIKIDPEYSITEHEASGRFIPLTQIKTSEDSQKFISDMIPLLHTEENVAYSIKYTISELVRNVLEHSCSELGAFVCAQYFKNSNKVSIGIADAGVGICKSIRRSHATSTDEDAIVLALTPGITGTTSKIGGTSENAGAGLFFVKSIAKTSRNFFLIYSGSAIFKLKKTPQNKEIKLYSDPRRDQNTFWRGVPNYPGTIIGIDISTSHSIIFQHLLNEIRDVYRLEVRKKKKEKYKKPRFV